MVLSPDAEPRLAPRRREANDFGYGSDAAGERCPLGAHVRRANPRDSARWQGRLTVRHRIIRRGMPYGPFLPVENLGRKLSEHQEHALANTEAEDTRPRGLMFVCYQADIERQFELIQRRWLGDGNSLGVGSDRDPLLAPGLKPDESGQMIIPGGAGEAPRFLTGIEQFVKTRGGGYYLLPGLPGLRALSEGSA